MPCKYSRSRERWSRWRVRATAFCAAVALSLLVLLIPDSASWAADSWTAATSSPTPQQDGTSRDTTTVTGPPGAVFYWLLHEQPKPVSWPVPYQLGWSTPTATFESVYASPPSGAEIYQRGGDGTVTSVWHRGEAGVYSWGEFDGTTVPLPEGFTEQPPPPAPSPQPAEQPLPSPEPSSSPTPSPSATPPPSEQPSELPSPSDWPSASLPASPFPSSSSVASPQLACDLSSTPDDSCIAAYQQQAAIDAHRLVQVAVPSFALLVGLGGCVAALMFGRR